MSSSILGCTDKPNVHLVGYEEYLCEGNGCRICQIWPAVQTQTKLLEGQLKTLIDSAIPEGNQNKALKDVLADLLWLGAERMTEVMSYIASQGMKQSK